MALASLESKDHRNLLDIIDKLRSQGISRYVDLPQLIVCGDQSSGKSSVLEAISGMSFPSKDQVCTRFATELILRRSPTKDIKISITPSGGHSQRELDKLQAFSPDVSVDDLDLGEVIDEAKDVMELSNTTSGSSPGKIFSTDILRIEISGPNQQNLTMVDLPGLFKAANREQSAEDVQLIQNLVLSYMQMERSIILAVVSAKNDFTLQEITALSRRLDPDGCRTLGLITKPDQLDENSEMERSYVKLAQNKDVPLQLGWHVLRNRDYQMMLRNATSAERDAAEEEFFSKGIWTKLDSRQVGVHTLRPRLSEVLKNQILSQLPGLLHDVESGIEDCKHRIQKLGDPRTDLKEQRVYLLKIAFSFSTILKASVDGHYNDPAFFTDAIHEEGYRRRLRAVVQNACLDFAETMRKDGHAKEIVDEVTKEDDRQISRNQYVEHVKYLMKRTRGCELPGTFNPLIVTELFSEQSKPWRCLIDKFVKDIFDAAYFTTSAVLQHTADGTTAESILKEIVHPEMHRQQELLHAKVEEIMKPHQSGHPITFNHYLTDNVQKAQEARRKRDWQKRLRDFFGMSVVEKRQTLYDVSLKGLLDKLTQETQADMDEYGGSSATDMMQAYYKVALKNVVDDIGAIVIDQCLMQKLPEVFSSETVCNLEEDDIRRIAAESEESAAERARMTEKLSVLENGLRVLQRMAKYREVVSENRPGQMRPVDGHVSVNDGVELSHQTRTDNDIASSTVEGERSYGHILIEEPGSDEFSYSG